MQLIFDSVDEVVDFVKNHLSTKARKGKGGDADEGAQAATIGGAGQQAPAPAMPPPNNPGAMQGFPQAGFAPPAGGAAPMGGGYPAPGAPVLAPEAQALLQKLAAGIDGSIASGAPTEPALNWFRNELAKVGIQAAASAADLNVIKGTFLPQLAAMNFPALQNIAKLMNIA